MTRNSTRTISVTKNHNSIRTSDGGIYTPFRVWVRDGGLFCGGDISGLFGRPSYRKHRQVNEHGRMILLDRIDDWLVVCDDWFYTLWNDPGTSRVIARLSRRFETATSCVGDADNSYSFCHLRDAKVIRDIDVHDDFFDPAKWTAVCNDGQALSEEPAICRTNDPMLQVDRIASAHGLPLPEYDRCTIYGPPNIG